jgi:hypothetical protein
VVSVPMELSSDHTAILQLAQSTCYVTQPGLRAALQWQESRLQMALQLLLQSGMAWVDEQGPPVQGDRRVYWFPSLWEQSRLEASGGAGAGGGGG